ncbi:beta/gamma crystallin family protein [Caulobacter segnis]
MHKTLGLAALSTLLLAGAASAQAPSWNGRYDDPPRGSYTQSCRDITAFNGQVWARCQTSRGGFEWSSARTRDCGGQGLENRDGRLQCVGYGGGGGGGNGGWNGGGGNNGGGWNNGGGGRPGGGRDGVVLFEDPQYQGRAYEVNGDMPDLGAVKFNDKASSIQIGRGGRWEICEHANYQGRCSRLDADQAILPREWNDQISSIRRVR